MPSGVSGDMLVAALLELTSGENFLKKELKKLSTKKNRLPKLSFETSIVNKGGIQSRQVEFNVPQNSKWIFDKNPITKNKNCRHLKEIFNILEKSDFPSQIVERAKKTFNILGEAEGKVHGMPKENIHFHEVGSLDAICDVVSTVLLIEKLGIKKIYASPIYLGQGTVDCAHGKMPVPVPAVVKMVETYSIPILNAIENTGELSTPTGVALLCGLVSDFQPPQNYVSIKSAYGAGQKEITGHVNVIRLRLVDVLEKNNSEWGFDQDKIWQIESNIDDMTSESLAYVVQGLLKAGSLESWLETIIMKKGRLAQKIVVLVKEEKKEIIVKKILKETSTLGIRIFPVDRVKFKRKIKTIEIGKHKVKIKLALLDNKIYKWKAEAEDVIRLCQKESISWDKANALIFEKAKKP